MQIKHNLLNYKRDTYINSSYQSFSNNTKLSVIDCSIGNNPFYFLNDIKNIIKHIKINQISLYQEISEIDLLKDKILEKYKNKKLSKNNIFLGNGSINIIERVIHKLVNPDKMIGIGPQFNEVPSEFIAAGGKYYSMPLIENNFNLDKLEKLLNNKLYDVLYIDNPNNPTGFVFDIKSISRLAKICDKRGTIFIIDEAYGDFIDGSNKRYGS